MRREEEQKELIVRQAYEEGPGELSSRNPMVLSCGGVYIPQRKRIDPDRPLWEIINLPDIEHPVKVVSSGIPKSPLIKLIEKESLN